MKPSLIVAAAVVLAGGLIATAILVRSDGGRADVGLPDPTPTLDQPHTLHGIFVLDGVSNGCGGEDILVSVRSGAGNAANTIASASFVGFDCAFEFDLPVPRLDCYELIVDGTPVGRYPFQALRDQDWNIGYIDRDSVYPDPETGDAAEAYQDWSIGC